MTGVRVDTVCRDYQSWNSVGVLPEDLKQKVRTMCLAAIPGDSRVLTEAEARKLESIVGGIYGPWGGVLKFAETMQGAVRPAARPFELPQAIVRLYDGFARMSVNEPPFLINGFEFKKTGGGKTGQTILINNAVEMKLTRVSDGVLVSLDGRALSGRRVGLFDYNVLTEIAGLLERHTGLGADVDDLLSAFRGFPFMEGYELALSSDNPGRYNNASAGHPKTKMRIATGGHATFEDSNGHARGGELFTDGFGRFFIEEFFIDKDGGKKTARVYVSSPNSPAPLYTLREGGSAFEPFEPLPRIEEKNFTSTGGGGCFTSTTLVQTKDGQNISMGELYGRFMRGEDIPAVRSYNPDTGEVVYQRPVNISRYYVDPEGGPVQFITYKGDNGRPVGAPLEVTPNHFLWTRRGGRQYWMPAGNVSAGDEILLARSGPKAWGKVTSSDRIENDAQIAKWRAEHRGVAGPSFSFDVVSKRPAEGVLDVYNISFDMGADGTYYNYSAGAKGSEAVVTHNGKLL